MFFPSVNAVVQKSVDRSDLNSIGVNSMKIRWLGHSCFKITSENSSVIFDPYENGSVKGLKDIHDSAQLVLCSHYHHDHGAFDSVKKEEGTCCFTTETIETYHDDLKGALRGTNTIHIISDGTYRLAHLGDLGCQLEEEQLQKLENLDVILIPVGGYYTIDGDQAARLIQRLHPSIVIPMHYRSDTFGFDVISTVEPFLSHFDHVRVLYTSTLEDLEAYRDCTVVLRPELVQ